MGVHNKPYDEVFSPNRIHELNLHIIYNLHDNVLVML